VLYRPQGYKGFTTPVSFHLKAVSDHEHYETYETYETKQAKAEPSSYKATMFCAHCKVDRPDDGKGNCKVCGCKF